jgi:hypothetical protein
MANKRKPCPYKTATQLEAAIREHGSVEGLASHIQHSPNLIRRWARDLGATTASGKTGAPPSHGTEALRRMSDAELETLAQTLGTPRLSVVLDVSESTIKTQLRGRHLSANTTMVATPRVQLLSKRIKELEQQDNALQELSLQIRQAAQIVATEPPARLPKVRTRKDRSAVDVILHVSDKQYGMLVNPDEVPGGAYSPELYEERLERYILAIDALLENTAAANPIGTVWIAQGGDFVEGDDVFKGHTWHLAIDAGEQVVRLGRIWAAALQRISQRARQVGAERIAVVIHDGEGRERSRGLGLIGGAQPGPGKGRRGRAGAELQEGPAGEHASFIGALRRTSNA